MSDLYGDSRIETAHIPRVAARYRDTAPPGQKRCNVCGACKPANREFWQSRGGLSGWQQPCKTCKAAKSGAFTEAHANAH